MAVAYSTEHFGDGFISTNEDGTRGIAGAVLSAFQTLTQGTVIWDRWEKCWRQRQPDDPARK
jgi:hypothetical protein